MKKPEKMMMNDMIDEAGGYIWVKEIKEQNKKNPWDLVRSGQLQSVPSLDGDVLYRVVSGQNVQVDRSRCFWDFWQAVF